MSSYIYQHFFQFSFLNLQKFFPIFIKIILYTFRKVFYHNWRYKNYLSQEAKFLEPVPPIPVMLGPKSKFKFYSASLKFPSTKVSKRGSAWFVPIWMPPVWCTNCHSRFWRKMQINSQKMCHKIIIILICLSGTITDDSKFYNFASIVQYLKFWFVWNRCILSMSLVIEQRAWYLIHDCQY